MTEDVKNCIEQAERFLALREHNKNELIIKLKNKDYDDNTISKALSFLTETDELNEERYIRSFIRSNNRRHPEGKGIVLQRLLAKGADKQLSAQILAEIYSENYENELLEDAYCSQIRRKKDISDEKMLAKLVKSGFKFSDSKKKIAEEKIK